MSRRYGGRSRAPLFHTALAAAACALPAAAAERPELHLPLDCTLGETCHIQQNVDRIDGPGQQDFLCGTALNDDHKGTDFALPSLAAMEAGVTVRAAAPGIVRGLRDGMPDIDASQPAAPELTGRECGNGVVIDHGGDWFTQYCHMREGSVAVETGDRVETGDALGLVGMSGLATFPHLHFSVRQDLTVIDPFLPDMTAACGTAEGPGMWATPLPFHEAGLIGIGIADGVPEYDAVKAGLPAITLPPQPDALVVWIYAYNGRPGDEVALALSGPDGPLDAERFDIDAIQPFFYRSWGLRAPAGGFAPGDYGGRATLYRDGTQIDARDITFTLH